MPGRSKPSRFCSGFSSSDMTLIPLKKKGRAPISALPILTQTEKINGRCKHSCQEEEGYFNSSCLGRVRAVYGIGVDAVSEIGADRAFFSFLRIGCAHQVAVFTDGAFAFQGLNHHRTRDHEINQIFEEGAFFVYGVELLSFAARQCTTAAMRLSSQCSQTAVDLADNIFSHGVRFDDGEGAFDSHDEQS